MLVTNDEMLRLPTERVLRAENFDVVSVNSRDNALFMLNRYCPSVIIVENGAISPRDIENIRMKYPAVRILITGEDSDYKDLEDIYFIPKPLNYAKLINKIKLIL